MLKKLMWINENIYIKDKSAECTDTFEKVFKKQNHLTTSLIKRKIKDVTLFLFSEGYSKVFSSKKWKKNFFFVIAIYQA